MDGNGKKTSRCQNPACGRVVAAGVRLCETCELEWTLYRRDLRDDDTQKEPSP